MILGEEGLNGEKPSALCSDLIALSGKYGKTERRVDGTLISNDEGYQVIMPRVYEHLATKRSGIGVFIGSGGLLSLHPDLPTDVNLVLDKNRAVLELNELIASLIKESSSPNEVLQKLGTSDLRNRNPVLKDLDKTYGEIDLTAGFLKHESRQYGKYHWTHPSRFKLVQESLRKKPIVSIAADITNRNLGTALSSVAQHYDLKIPFANFTNVHAWIRPMPMDFIRNWPFEPDAAILYSSHKDGLVGDWPKMYLAKSPEEYIFQTKMDATN